MIPSHFILTVSLLPNSGLLVFFTDKYMLVDYDDKHPFIPDSNVEAMISLSDVDLLAKIRPLTLVDLKLKKFYFIYREEVSVVASDEANLLHLTSRFTVPSYTTKNNKYIKKISKSQYTWLF